MKFHKLISKGVSKLYNERPCKDAETLLSCNITEWIKNRPINVVKHLQALCNLKDSKYENYLFAKILEQLYNCRNSRLVLPLSFQENLVTYKCSNSSLLTALNSASMPSGGHTSVTKKLKKAASTEIPFSPGIVRFVFDNEQVIGKRYRVKPINPQFHQVLLQV